MSNTVRNAAFILGCLLCQGCTTELEPQFGTVDWYLNNSSGTRITLNVYDKVCKRTQFRIHVERSSEELITSCANEQGRAEIRYQRSGGNSRGDNHWRDSTAGDGQSVLVN